MERPFLQTDRGFLRDRIRSDPSKQPRTLYGMALPEQAGTAVPAETGQAVARRALGRQPRLLDDPRDGTEGPGH